MYTEETILLATNKTLDIAGRAIAFFAESAPAILESSERIVREHTPAILSLFNNEKFLPVLRFTVMVLVGRTVNFVAGDAPMLMVASVALNNWAYGSAFPEIEMGSGGRNHTRPMAGGKFYY